MEGSEVAGAGTPKRDWKLPPNPPRGETEARARRGARRPRALPALGSRSVPAGPDADALSPAARRAAGKRGIPHHRGAMATRRAGEQEVCHPVGGANSVTTNGSAASAFAPPGRRGRPAFRLTPPAGRPALRAAEGNSGARLGDAGDGAEPSRAARGDWGCGQARGRPALCRGGARCGDPGLPVSGGGNGGPEGASGGK